MNPEAAFPSRSAYFFPSLLFFFFLSLFGGLSTGCGGEVPPAPEPEIPSLDGERINSYYTNEEIKYFLDLAIGDSLEQAISDHTLRTLKWLRDIRIALAGHPTAEDSATARRVVEELNRQVYGIEISLTDRNPNVVMYFVPKSEFHLVEPSSQPGDRYGAWVYWTTEGRIDEATILIPSDSTIDQDERDPKILRNTAAILGLLNLSTAYPESIFYYWENWANRLAPIDRKMIEILYLPEIRPGMTREEAILALANR